MLEKLSVLPPEARTMTLAWGVLLHDIGKPATFRSAAQTATASASMGTQRWGCGLQEEVCRRFRFSNEETEQVVSLVANHMRFKDVPANAGIHPEAFCPVAKVRKSTWNYTG